MDCAEAAGPILCPVRWTAMRAGVSRRGGFARGFNAGRQCRSAKGQPGVEQPLVQILVVVATIPVRTWKTEVEKGFLGTGVGQE